MTTRKRLTDMVREEVQKSAGTEILTEVTIDVVETSSESEQDNEVQGELISNQTVKESRQETEPQKNLSDDRSQANLALKQQLAQAESKIASLTSELHQTQSYLAQASQVKADLDTATAENQALKAEVAELKGQNSQLSRTQAKAPLARADQEKLRISQLLHRPVGSNAEQNRINNQNIGWFD
jgi:multidrug efflux pump subunit AcrA (membrane-fusion protein)